MIFLDFIWLFIFMVLIDSRPMFKSMDENYSNGGTRLQDKIIQAPIYRYNNYGRKFYTKSREDKNKVKNQEIDLSGFQKFISHNLNHTTKKHNFFESDYSHKNLSNMLIELTTEVESLKRLYNLETSSDAAFRYKETESFKYIPEDNRFIESTAEIETVLNEIKQRALKMMIQQIPSSANIISTAVTETVYDVESVMRNIKMITDYDITSKKSPSDDKDSYYNRRIRSVYNKAATMAQDLECNLQNKALKSYKEIKEKVSANLSKELKHSQNAIKAALNRLNCGKGFRKSKHNQLLKNITQLTTTDILVRKSTTQKVSNAKKKSYTKRTTPTHVIPKVTDDYSMLSVYEKILSKSHRKLQMTKTPFIPLLSQEKLLQRNHESIENIHLKRSVQKLYDDEEMPEVNEDYSEEKNITSEIETGFTNSPSLKTSGSEEDISFNTLSNKLSYNDYVNGFKYYLNFQKDQNNQNFSNLVRYQAHKHHNVEDVGKYILDKLPKLPSTRQRRYLFEQDTLEDQDISTKSDDSWFKKHFYLFIDRDPPKKYHTVQTVSLKEDQKNYTTTRRTVQNLKQNKKQNKIKRTVGKFLIKRKPYKTKLKALGSTTTLFGKNSKKNGYIDVNLVHRPTGVVKLQNKEKKRKFKNIFKKINFSNKAHKKDITREKFKRKKRSNPFKILKNILLRNQYTDSNNKVRKIFDYDVVTTSINPYYNFINHNNDQPNIEGLLRQVPNITSKLESHDYDQYYYVPNTNTKPFHNKGLYHMKPRPSHKSHDLSLLPDLQVETSTGEINNYQGLQNTQYFDDVINVRIKTSNDQVTRSTFNEEEMKNIDPLLKSLLGNLSTENFVTTESNYYKNEKFKPYFPLHADVTSDVYESHTKKKQKSDKGTNKFSYKLILYDDYKKENKLENWKSPYSNQQISKRAKSGTLFKHNKNFDKTSVNTNKKHKASGSKNKSQTEDHRRVNQGTTQKKPLEHAATSKLKTQKPHPDHFFSTPLPMPENDFNKFLEDNHIDVQSVTAPLPNSIPFSNDINSYKDKELYNAKNRKYNNKSNNYNYYIDYGTRIKREKVSTKKCKLLKFSKNQFLMHETTLAPNNNVQKRHNEDVKPIHTFTAHNVAALEVIVDLKKCQDSDENQIKCGPSERIVNSINENNKLKVTNSIQVHIALPDNYGENTKRSPESVQLKKVFSAIMASPVDIAYQLHTFEKTTIPTTTTEESKLSPGLYLLVENANSTDPTAQLILKPMKMDMKKLNLELKTNEIISEPSQSTSRPLSMNTNEDNINSNEGCKHKRSLHWDSIKKYFGHDRVCKCRCKANQTMCKACAASNAVMAELIFEFDNLSKYMKEHCTEIQTFFWTNPTGGKKLREAVNKINKSLNDYYKRVRGKCNGRTCKMFSSGIDKRSLQDKFIEENDEHFLANLLKIANDLEKYNMLLGLIYDDQFKNHGDVFQKTLDNCLARVLAKRSDSEYAKDIYSLDKININLLCDSCARKDNLLHGFKSNKMLIKNVTGKFLNHNEIFSKEEKRKDVKDFLLQRLQSKIPNKEILLESDHKNLILHSDINNGHKNLRLRRKIKPLVNVLLFQGNLNNEKLKNNSNIKIKKLKTTNLPTKNNSYNSYDNLLVQNMNQLFQLLGNTNVKDSSSIISGNTFNTEAVNTIRATTVRNTKKIIKNILTTSDLKMSTLNLSQSTKHGSLNESNKIGQTLQTTHNHKFLGSFMGVTTRFMNMLKSKTANLKKSSGRHERNVTIDAYLRNSNQMDFNSHIISSVTERNNPTIIILGDNMKDFVTSKNEPNNENDLRSLLLSVLNYNSKVLNNEWVRVATSNVRDNGEKRQVAASISKKSTKKIKQGQFNKLAQKFLWSKNYDKKKKEQVRLKPKPVKTSSSINSKKDSTTVHYMVNASGLSSPEHFKDVNSTNILFLPMTTRKIGGKSLKTVCDISSTFGHILSTQKSMTKRDFERYVKKIDCYKYRVVPKMFMIKFNRRKKHCKKGLIGLRHNDKRWRRDSKMELYDGDEEALDTGLGVRKGEETNLIFEVHESNEKYVFEKYVEGHQGLYELAAKRKKRHCKGLIDYLTDLPPLKPLTDEVFVMIGDSILLNCYESEYKNYDRKDHKWTASSHNFNKDFAINGSKIYIQNIQKEHSGTYLCNDCHNIIVRRVKVNVMDVPKFNVVFTPVYKTSSSCTYNDLRAIQTVGELMSKTICENYCSIRIEEPVCLKDREEDSYLLKTVTVLSPKYPIINCSAECQRNVRSSMAVLYSKNAPVLASIPVMMMYSDGTLLEEIKTWTPSIREHKAFVSHTLRTRDSKGHYDYHSLAANSEPGTVHVVVSCPAGFFLVSSQKICGVCPSNTYSIEGENTCAQCAAGTDSAPGSDVCRLSLDRLRRSIWNVEPCLSVKGIGVVAIILLMLYSISRLICYFKSCSACRKEQSSKKPKVKLQLRQRQPAKMINRLLKGSSTSIDSGSLAIKERKKKNKPPLPPLDF